MLTTAIQCSIGEDKCGGEIKDQKGELSIPQNSTRCVFTTSQDTKEIILDTDGLSLTAGDKITITSPQNQVYEYKPPTDAGYIHICGVFATPTLTFVFANGSNSDMKIKYNKESSLPINVDINHNFKIINVGAVTDLELNFMKTLNETVHIELSPPDLSEKLILGNLLMNPNQTTLTIFGDVKRDIQLIQVKTVVVDKRCSNDFADLTKAQEISGPQFASQSYECVNLFKLADQSPESHFDVDFSNFLALASDNDELVVSDASRRLLIDRSSEADYSGRKMSTTGSELVVNYKGVNISDKNVGLGLKLTVAPEKYGGIVRDKKDLNLLANIPTIYTLVPLKSKCMNLLSSQASLVDSYLNVTINGVLSKFGPNSLLPPILGSPEEMTLSYLGKTGIKFQFSPDGSCCHQLTSGHFSVDVPQNGSCFWTVPIGGSIAFDENNLSPGGCITVQPLNANVPLYSRCNIAPKEIIPRLVVSQAYVNVTLPKKLTASVISEPAKISFLDNIYTTPGYPVFYPIATSSETFMFNATNRKYLIHVNDIDLPAGEKLKIGNLDIRDRSNLQDFLLVNATANITLTRPTAPTDFSLHRGLNISAISFEDIRLLSGNMTSNNSVTMQNVTNSLIKIALEGSYRINYDISSTSEIDLHLYDGLSISGPASTTRKGSTTSSSLLIIAKSPKNATITIQYRFTACETDALPCDNKSRCIPREFQCQGKFYCADGSDMKQVCNSTGPPPPPSGQTGVGGLTVFILCTLMLALGVLLTTYGPGIYQKLEGRFRGAGQYNSFNSVE